MIKRHGYYLPAQNLLRGDQEFSQEAKTLFDDLNLPLDNKGKYQGGRYDGISICQKEDGTIVKRLCLEDFFSPTFRVLVRDYPDLTKAIT